MSKKLRILIGKVGLDGHDRGAKVIAHALRDAGFEVIYTGIRMTPEQITESAKQENVDAIGISIHSGAHNHLIPSILELLKSEKLNMKLFVGGIIPEEDSKSLKKKGVAEIFDPGTSLVAIVKWVKENVYGTL